MHLTLQNHKTLYSLSNKIRTAQLNVLDAIVVKEKEFPFIDHYALFGGFDEAGYPIIAANYKTAEYTKGGVRILPQKDLLSFLKTMRLSRIRRFKGDKYKWEQAFRRAQEVFEKKPYNLIHNNCEHYINYVHHGNAYSQQTQIASTSIAAAGLATAVSSSNPFLQILGALALGAGVISLGTELSKQASFNTK